MALARLLIASLLLSSVSALTQDSRIGVNINGPLSTHAGLYFWMWGTAATALEPWRLIPERPADASSARNPLDRIRIGQDGFGQSEANRNSSRLEMGHPFSNGIHSCSQLPDEDPTCRIVRLYFMSLLPNGRMASIDVPSNESDADTTCYSIRSYVAARDSKDSDSTHLAGYSTCQPTNRYRLKRTEIRVESPDR